MTAALIPIWILGMPLIVGLLAGFLFREGHTIARGGPPVVNARGDANLRGDDIRIWGSMEDVHHERTLRASLDTVRRPLTRTEI
jgi:hypothetical protein